MTALTGSRVRERRLALGLKQADLARAAGVSASYLNLIEHNRRRIGEEVLTRLALALGIGTEALAEGAAGVLLDDLRAAAAESGGGVQAEIDKTEDFAGRFPGWSGLLAAQHRRLGQLERAVSALNDRMTHDPHLSQALHEVLSAVSSVRSTAAILAESEDIDPVWRARFHGNLHQDSERLAVGAEALVAYLDGSEQAEEQGIAAPQEEIEAWLAGRGWQLDGGAGDEVAALASGAARVMARDLVARAGREAGAMPLAPFRAAWGAGEDPARIAARFGVGVLAVFRRAALLPGTDDAAAGDLGEGRRPQSAAAFGGTGDRKMPPGAAVSQARRPQSAAALGAGGMGAVGLVICDASGTLVFRKPADGFALPRFGAACPLWPLYTALSRPGSPVTALVEMAGRLPRRYRVQAFCETQLPRGFAGPEVREAGMLIEPFDGPPPPGVLLIGTTCRICPRAECAARREPSILSEGV